ncbi:hypothetical protein [Pontivivens insulae]|uniref:Uncharacterized protein n=1 Tax=Pontivivens insulae TaxID=1639689 RepID=A0A2R8AD40_9RHOB|nr:hypothetical protein [Pontivivens insulae]RED14065.1 hypothetical protein DFR53_1417 [Pontivivens insulae]SPF30139.1 hypothetical protein POI8812_02471 [Pontivivens insulae]
MPTSKGLLAKLIAASAFLALAACEAPQGSASSGSGVERLARDPDALRSAVVELGGSEVRIGVPRGTCIAPQSVSVRGDIGAVIAGDCRAVVLDPPRRTGPNALLSATVSADPLPGDGTPAERVALIEEMLHGGLADSLLGEQSGNADLVETRLDEDTIYALVDTGSEVAFQGASPLMWRAITQERGHMIVLTARTLRQDTAGTQALLDSLRAFRTATRQVNRRR